MGLVRNVRSDKNLVIIGDFNVGVGEKGNNRWLKDLDQERGIIEEKF